jgi:hypothetical protein
MTFFAKLLPLNIEALQRLDIDRLPEMSKIQPEAFAKDSIHYLFALAQELHEVYNQDLL